MNRNQRLIKLAVVIFCFVIIPMAGAYFLFWHDVSVSVTYKEFSDEKTKADVAVHINEILKPNPKNTARKIFQVPFDLTFYNLCFKYYLNETSQQLESLNGLATISLYKEKDELLDKFSIRANKKNCVVLNTENFVITSVINVQSITNFPFNELAFEYWVRPDEKATPVRSNQWASSVIFLFAVWGILFSFIKLWNLLKLITINQTKNYG